MPEESKKIIVVEDDKFLSNVLNNKLNKDGYSVTTVTDGNQAVPQIKAIKPDLVLLDLMMPGKDGFDVLTEVKADPEIAHIPIIVSSNLSQESDQQKCIDLGAVDYIVKANTPLFEVVEKIKKHLA